MASVSVLNAGLARPAVAASARNLSSTAVSMRPFATDPRANRINIFAMSDFHACDPDNVIRQLEINDVITVQNGQPVLSKHPYAHRYIINLGDYFDRGPFDNGYRIWSLFRGLQDQASMDETTDVIRLAGNHEMAKLRHQILNHDEPSKKNRDWIRHALTVDINAGDVTAAFAERDVLYTHAGVDPDFMPEFFDMTAEEAAVTINQRLMFALKYDDYSDRIFDSRSGIFWTARQQNLLKTPFRQVVGHVTNWDAVNYIFHGIDVPQHGHLKRLDAGRRKGEQVTDKFAFQPGGVPAEKHLPRADEIYFAEVDPLAGTVLSMPARAPY